MLKLFTNFGKKHWEQKEADSTPCKAPDVNFTLLVLRDVTFLMIHGVPVAIHQILFCWAPLLLCGNESTCDHIKAPHFKMALGGQYKLIQLKCDSQSIKM